MALRPSLGGWDWICIPVQWGAENQLCTTWNQRPSAPAWALWMLWRTKWWKTAYAVEKSKMCVPSSNPVTCPLQVLQTECLCHPPPEFVWGSPKAQHAAVWKWGLWEGNMRSWGWSPVMGAVPLLRRGRGAIFAARTEERPREHTVRRLPSAS